MDCASPFHIATMGSPSFNRPMLGLYGAEEKGGGNEVIFYGGCS